MEHANTQRYEKAKKFLPQNIMGLIKNLQPTIAWSPDEQLICYRHDVAEGYEYLVFDLRSKKKELAFDHSFLAQKIAEHLNKEVNASSLPVETITFLNDHLLQLHIGEFIFQYDRSSQKVLIQDKAKPVAMTHCPTIKEIWGFVPTLLLSRIRSPDERWDIYTKDYNLYLLSLEEQKEYQLTADGSRTHPYATSPDTNLTSLTLRRMQTILPPMALWSPDSQKLVTFQCNQEHVEKLALLQHVPEDGSLRPQVFEAHVPLVGDEIIPEIQLCLLDVSERKLRQIDMPPLMPALVGSPIEAGYVWWSEDSKKIFFIKEERGNHQLSLCELDIAREQQRVILTEKSHTFVEPSQLILWENYTRILQDTNEFIWMSAHNGWPHLYLHDLQTGALKNPITKGEWTVRKVFHVDTANRWIYLLGNGKEPDADPYFRYLYRARLDGSEVQLLTPETAEHTIVYSPSQEYFIDYYSTMDSLPTTKLRATDGQEIATLEQADFSQLFGLGYKFPQPFCCKAADGETDIYGLMYFPTDFDPQKKYPLIDDIYPGPQLTRVPKSYCFDLPEYVYGCWSAQSLAELGFIVINVDGRGTPFRSKKFHEYSYQHLETAGGLEDHMAAIRYLARQYSYIDMERIGIIGQSAGGYAATRALLAYPDFFKVGVCVSGLQDLRSYLAFWGERYQGMPDEVDYSAQSNYPLVNTLKGNLFLIHGELDDNVHPANLLQLAEALIKADKDFDMLIVPNANHSLYFTSTYVWRRIWDYFILHLNK
ncbi:DPP IV N-terminal domain-containing protein [Fluoribacter dumoffii]|uniref:Prolyl tripeptidyl peptidase n=1 Tax=Fluoribacter dumoffii TaxID=463 RepID=A0A377GDM5_9GAMM|nr:DPP IV N-terminal domain-containing protein [Fluoribacter dumoffii]KTC91159.1 Prolyl tripeptidyl peptidase precursor [Fluoribacter dumoffii NY 23]MCW8416781.1 DPP IV N-terminal domain-containing protein [Fluoribacter dumoffii]MCW8455379.1 DPP IV N-terminal domain-containing protein [Fluoribacter dumoffii]MCW8460543.1 DPP IV N-terminal domain-containing protein [Fluoribacter dumoffii]MCW8484024.1 DPP IV N-terminal domain-containing protein [Fluoribacter dumoffii]